MWEVHKILSDKCLIFIPGNTSHSAISKYGLLDYFNSLPMNTKSKIYLILNSVFKCDQ